MLNSVTKHQFPISTVSACLLVVILLTACASQTSNDHHAAFRQFQNELSNDKIIVVRASYADQTQLRIDDVIVTTGSFPPMQDSPHFDGRLELVNASGDVVWEMGYQSRTTRLFLRAPGVSGAVKVRLREPGRNIEVVAELPD